MEKKDSKDASMVLQLVLPSGSQNSNNLDNNNYLTATSLEDILGNQNIKKRHRNGSLSSQLDHYSTIGTDGCCVNHGYTKEYSIPDYGRITNLDSMSQTPAPSNDSHFSPAAYEEKRKYFRNLLTTILSGIYAIFIVTIGLAVYVTDVIVGNSPLAETFSLYLVFIALLYVLFLVIDIAIFMKRKRALQKSDWGEYEMKITSNHFVNIESPESNSSKHDFKHDYCFKKDRHSTNFYIKIGAAGFCLGHLIHSGLLLGYQIVFLTSEDDTFYECATVTTLLLDLIYPVYSFILLFFIFKYSNIIINKHFALARFGIMHCISSSLCFWMWTIFRETLESLSNHSNDKNNDTKDLDDHDDDDDLSEVTLSNELELLPVALPLSSYNQKGAQLLTTYLNSSLRRFRAMCEADEGLTIIYKNYSPYLYPFSVEYSVLVVGVLFIIWNNIGNCKDTENTTGKRQCNEPKEDADTIESNIVIHVDCHSANKGLFGGIVIMVVTVVSIILFFIAISDGKHQYLANTLNNVISVIVIFLMTIAGILAYRQITKLDINFAYHGLLDELLLFICIPAFFLNGIFSVIPAITSKNTLSTVLIILEVIQVLIQTPLIIDGLRRSSNTRENRREKPGRELVTFLIVCNIAMWITNTFEVKSNELQDSRYEFYGRELWTIIGHMCVPLMMFYRFHSSVCIVDIWKFAYEPASH